MKMGRFTEVREEIQRAITMTQNLREQELLTERLKQIEKERPCQHRCGSVL
jgi:RNA polymerase sigma-70 factor, ECF subfamily